MAKILLFGIIGIRVDGFKLTLHIGIITLLFCLASRYLHHRVSIQVVLLIWDTIWLYRNYIVPGKKNMAHTRALLFHEMMLVVRNRIGTRMAATIVEEHTCRACL